TPLTGLAVFGLPPRIITAGSLESLTSRVSVIKSKQDVKSQAEILASKSPSSFVPLTTPASQPKNALISTTATKPLASAQFPNNSSAVSEPLLYSTEPPYSAGVQKFARPQHTAEAQYYAGPKYSVKTQPSRGVTGLKTGSNTAIESNLDAEPVNSVPPKLVADDHIVGFAVSGLPPSIITVGSLKLLTSTVPVIKTEPGVKSQTETLTSTVPSSSNFAPLTGSSMQPQNTLTSSTTTKPLASAQIQTNSSAVSEPILNSMEARYSSKPHSSTEVIRSGTGSDAIAGPKTDTEPINPAPPKLVADAHITGFAVSGIKSSSVSASNSESPNDAVPLVQNNHETLISTTPSSLSPFSLITSLEQRMNGPLSTTTTSTATMTMVPNNESAISASFFKSSQAQYSSGAQYSARTLSSMDVNRLESHRGSTVN
ncbi:unnamed protein product, partial [Enterobius vermicularis]|uniref:KIAA1549 like n=1 Tax=Enterobius vermicularis TaxID=51028 RepID=A0A0N4UTV0_ENTVE